jgi:hypothetical protein
MKVSRKTMVGVGALVGLAVLAAAASAVLDHPAPVDADGDALLDPAVALALQAEAGTLPLEPKNKISVVVLGADAVPEKAAPAFFPLPLEATGAARVMLMGKPASLVRYTGDLGPLTVISVKATLDDLPAEAGVMPFQSRTFHGARRPRDAAKPGLNVVVFPSGSRLNLLLGRQSLTKLVELAWQASGK